MKITKFEQSCLLVEMPPPANRTVLFDPGSMSKAALNIDQLEYLDDIIITHGHGDHYDMSLVKKLVEKFPQVKITATREVVEQLKTEGLVASDQPSDGIVFFDAPHESVEPLYPQPEEIGVHYLDKLTHPGDCHSFAESKVVLALPVTGPWGSLTAAIHLALQLKPQYIVPIHDWHWREEARQQAYDNCELLFNKQGITFLKMKTGEAVVINV